MSIWSHALMHADAEDSSTMVGGSLAAQLAGLDTRDRTPASGWHTVSPRRHLQSALSLGTDLVAVTVPCSADVVVWPDIHEGWKGVA